MTMHVLDSGAQKAPTDRTLCCGRLVGELPDGDDVTSNPIYYTCSDPGPAAMTVRRQESGVGHRQDVALVVRSHPRFDAQGSDPEDRWEMVVAVEINGHRLELPENSQVIVDHEAGGGRNEVTLTLLAHTVRYIPEEPDEQPAHP